MQVIVTIKSHGCDLHTIPFSIELFQGQFCTIVVSPEWRSYQRQFDAGTTCDFFELALRGACDQGLRYHQYTHGLTFSSFWQMLLRKQPASRGRFAAN